MSYLTLGTKSLWIILQPTTRWQYRCFGFTLEELSIPHSNIVMESNRSVFTQHRLNIFCFFSTAWCWITKHTKTTVLCLQGGLPGRTVLICPSAPALQFLDVSLADPWEKSHLGMNRHLTSKMTAYTPSHHPVLPELWHTHITTFLSSLLTCTGKFATALLSHAFCIIHAHTYTHRSSTLKGDSEWEVELVKRRHSWRNVSSVTVTFDGDKCESAAAQRLAGSFGPNWLPCSVLTIFRWRAIGVVVSTCERNSEVLPTEAIRWILQHVVYF